MVFYEGGENSGVFYNTDDKDNSNLDVSEAALRGFTATFDYNDSAQSFLVANDFGTIEMVADSVGDVWNSGEALTVTIIDQDLNKNSGSDEDLVLANTTNTHLIPTLTIGAPLSIDATDGQIVSVTTYSNIAYFTNSSVEPTTNMLIKTGIDGTEFDAIDTENTYFNYNVASLFNSTEVSANVCLSSGLDSSTVVCESASTSGIVEIDQLANGRADTTGFNLNITKTANTGVTQSFSIVPIVADVFSFGAGVNNAIYRILLEETDLNTATFEGTIEYTMLNQININLDSTYTDLATIDSDVDVIVEQDMTDEDSLRVNYLDLGADGVSTQIADQMEAPTHDGVVSFDLDNYKIGDNVVLTLEVKYMYEDS
jgi:hypothetical protein